MRPEINPPAPVFFFTPRDHRRGIGEELEEIIRWSPLATLSELQT